MSDEIDALLAWLSEAFGESTEETRAAVLAAHGGLEGVAIIVARVLLGLAKIGRANDPVSFYLSACEGGYRIGLHDARKGDG